MRVDRLGEVEVSTGDVVGLVAALADACRHTRDDARLAEVIAARGADILRAELGPHLAWSSSVDADDEPVADEPRPGLFATGDGRSFVLAGARFGRIDAGALGHLASFSLDLRVTPWRSFAVGVAADDTGAVALLDHLARLGLLIDPADLAVGVVSCVGGAGCWQTDVDTLAEAERIVAERATATAATGAGTDVGLGTVHVSGCDKRCATRRPVALTRMGRPDGSGFDTVVDR